MVEYMPSLRKAHFYSSLYRWSQCEKLRDTKAAIQKAADEAGISLIDARDLFKEVSKRNTLGLANTGDRAIVNFVRMNWEKFALASEELIQAK